MNKYQKAAAFDMIKMVGVVLAGSVTAIALSHFFTAMHLVIALVVISLGYTGVTLFNIRADQHRLLDELKKREEPEIKK